ncbi:MAG: hypothetical protein FWC15_04140 [Fibromonadales bacterium]|nr:hypothetical protein [Fibromonadales bacterium]
MIRHFFVLFLGVCIAACSSNGSSGNEEQHGGSARLVLGRLQIPLFDSVTVHVYAEDMENMRISANSVSENIKIDGIPLGEYRKFEVKVYADKGKEVLKGEATTNIVANQTASILIPLTALYGFLRLEIPLGLANSENIHSGTLFLDSRQFQMQIETGKGIFNTGALPINQTFNLRIELKDQNDKVLFYGEKSVKISAIRQTEIVPLYSTMGSITLELETSALEPLQILAVLPTSKTRTPQHYGDLFFTEFRTSPDSYEYMEIYNATLDTLELSNCRVAKTRTSSEGQSRFSISKYLAFPPMEFLLLGRELVEDADFNYTKFILTDDGQTIIFFCDDLVIDSLVTNQFPLKTRRIHLPISNFMYRDKESSWCAGFSPKQDAECP